MTRARTAIRTFGLLGAAALVAAGCGGGEAPPAATGATPTPGTDPNAATVGADGTTTPAVDPVTGLPVDPAAVPAGGGAATASVPDLTGDDVAGGLGSNESNPIFLPGAVDTEAAKELFKEEETADDPAKDSAEEDVEKKPAVVFSGAKIYVDGIVHDVNENGTFP
jgi:hypothetical protein